MNELKIRFKWASWVFGGLVLLGLLFLRCFRDSDSSTRDNGTLQTASGTVDETIPGADERVADSSAPSLKSWLAGAGHVRRRIAGRVTADGVPVRGATVRLGNWASQVAQAPFISMETTIDGTFDFGEHPIGPYTVAAYASGKTQAVAHVDLANPKASPAPDRLELKLGNCDAALYGEVRDGSGGTITKARIRADVAIAAFSVESNDTGSYEICLPRGANSVVAEASGYGTITINLTLYGKQRHDIVLVPEATVVGRCVATEDESPVEAVVLLRPIAAGGGSAGAALVWAACDGDGRFRATGVAPGRYSIRAENFDRISTQAMEIIAIAGQASEDIVVKLDAASRISGTVLMDGRPVVGAHIAIQVRSTGRGNSATYSENDGRFELTRVPRGDIEFSAVPYQVITPKNFTVNRARHEGVVIEVTKLGMIRGHVLRGGKIVQDADIACRGGSRFSPIPNPSNSDGEYVCEGLGAGEYTLVAVDQAGGAYADDIRVSLATGEEKVVDIELKNSASIAGIVVDQDGKRMKGVHVRFIKSEDGDLGEGVTDDVGQFVVRLLAGHGEYSPAVSATESRSSAYTPVSSFPAVSVPDSNSHVDGVVLKVFHDAYSIRGKVLDASGAPAVDARIMAQRNSLGMDDTAGTQSLPTTISDAEGGFSLEDLPRGEYVVRARGTNGADSPSIIASAGTTGVLLRLTASSAIEGKLIGFKHDPIVYAQLAGGGGRLTSGQVEGDSFRIRGLAPGRYAVTAMNSAEGEVQIVDLSAGKTGSMTMTSHGSAALSGRVVELESRAPAAGMRCHVVARSGEFVGTTDWGDNTGSVETSSDGTFSFSEAPAGEVFFQCLRSGPERSGAGYALTLTTGERREIEVAVVRRNSVRSGKNISSIGATLDWTRVVPRIQAIDSGGPSARAGLVVGDLISSVDNVKTDGLALDAVNQLLLDHEAGTEVNVAFVRGAQAYRVKVAVGTPPAN